MTNYKPVCGSSKMREVVAVYMVRVFMTNTAPVATTVLLTCFLKDETEGGK